MKINWHKLSEWASIVHVLTTGVPMAIGFVLWLGHSPLLANRSTLEFLWGAETALLVSLFVRLARYINSVERPRVILVLAKRRLRQFRRRAMSGELLPQVTVTNREHGIVVSVIIGRHTCYTIAFRNVTIIIVT